MVDKERTQAPFNMALMTLESIREWIDNIAKVSIGYVGGQRILPNDIIVSKQRMVKQLIMLAAPLLDSKQLEEINKFFLKITIKKAPTIINQRKVYIPVYSQDVDYELDECVHGVEKALQEEGHFMPSADESSLF